MEAPKTTGLGEVILVKIPVDLKRRLLSEFNYLTDMIEKDQAPKKKTFWLSAAHGAIERTMRYHSDNELLVVHAILNIHYNAVQGILGRIAAGDDSVPLTENFWEKIIENLRDLSTLIDENKSTYPALEKIQAFAYAQTGPGYYTVNYLNSLIAEKT